MHSASVDSPPYSPTLDYDCSFPERHFLSGESAADGSHQAGMPSLVDSAPGPSQSEVNKACEPSFPSVWPLDWTAQPQTLFLQNGASAPNLTAENNILPSSLHQTARPMQEEWGMFREQSPGAGFWNLTPPDSVEDDSDSMLSPRDSPQNFSPQMTAWQTLQRLRRRSLHRVAKPLRVPAPTYGPVLQTGVHANGYAASDLGFSDSVAGILLDKANTAHDGAEIDIVFQDSASASKDDSKRIAHKLSEKSRRNRLTLAIREIQKLLPAEGNRQETDPLARPGMPISKLDVVEMAIGFIKDLKERNTAMENKIKEVEAILAECHCRGKKGDSGTSSQGITTN